MKKQISLKGKDRIAWNLLRGRAAQAVKRAVTSGVLSDLKKNKVRCTDCHARASMYDHRDYNHPLKVDPVCQSCNIMRGTTAPKIKEKKPVYVCPKCTSSMVLTSKKTKKRWCRRCGHEWK